MTPEQEKLLGEKLDKVTELLQHLVALEMSSRGVSQEAIGKKIRVAKATVGKMLLGMKKAPNER